MKTSKYASCAPSPPLVVELSGTMSFSTGLFESIANHNVAKKFHEIAFKFMSCIFNAIILLLYVYRNIQMCEEIFHEISEVKSKGLCRIVCLVVGVIVSFPLCPS